VTTIVVCNGEGSKRRIWLKLWTFVPETCDIIWPSLSQHQQSKLIFAVSQCSTTTLKWLKSQSPHCLWREHWVHSRLWLHMYTVIALVWRAPCWMAQLSIMFHECLLLFWPPLGRRRWRRQRFSNKNWGVAIGLVPTEQYVFFSITSLLITRPKNTVSVAKVYQQWRGDRGGSLCPSDSLQNRMY